MEWGTQDAVVTRTGTGEEGVGGTPGGREASLSKGQYLLSTCCGLPGPESVLCAMVSY